jgi:hypothetical protein
MTPAKPSYTERATAAILEAVREEYDFRGQPTPRPRADGTHRLPDPEPAPMAQSQQPSTPETWWESTQRAQRARAGRLRSLWQMTPAERVAAMRRGDLTYEQLAAWTARYPEQVPTVHGEFEWIVAKLPEACE